MVISGSLIIFGNRNHLPQKNPLVAYHLGLKLIFYPNETSLTKMFGQIQLGPGLTAQIIIKKNTPIRMY